MIEFLGIGIPRLDGWLLHRICAHLGHGAVVAVCSTDPAEREALLDTVAGRRIPEEGRVWVSGIPVVRERRARLRELVTELDLDGAADPDRSALWNVLARQPRLGRLGRVFRFPGQRERRAALAALGKVGLEGRSAQAVAHFDPAAALRLKIARGLWRGPEYLLVREPEPALGEEALRGLLALLRRLVRGERLGALVSGTPSEPMLDSVDRVLLLAGGLLVFDGAPGDLAARRRRADVSAS